MIVLQTKAHTKLFKFALKYVLNVLNEIFFPHFVVENGCKHQCLDIKNVLI